MNKFSKLFLALGVSTMMLSSCSSDEPAGVVTPTQGDVYATLTLSLPQGSRSETIDDGDNTNSNDGYEVGKDEENNVGSVLVVLATKEGETYKYVTSSLTDAHATTPGTNPNRPTYNVQFETRDLVDNAGTDVCVFAYCNPTADLVAAAEANFPEGFADLMGNITTGNIWASNGFLMTNASLNAAITLPSKEDMDEVYNTPTNPFNLGTVKVERAAVRFDFKETTISGQTVANRYPIFNHNNTEGETKELMGYVQLDGMALLNQAKNYYYLRRVSSNGMNAGATLCGAETTTNYVVSPFDAQKTAGNFELSFLTTNYMFTGQPTTGTATAGVDFTSFAYETIGSNLGDDNDPEWGDTDLSDDQKKDYKIWKYTTENTIPGLDQRRGVTTGIVFKGHLKGVEGSTLAEGIATKNTLYALNGIIYGDLAMLKDAVLANPVSVLAETFKTQFNVTEITEEALAGVTTDLTSTVKDGFALYRYDAATQQYPVYYAYYNRHNDNGLAATMGIMEFAVVRNNIYKIAVADIIQFGHPANPGDDPDPENPDNPDETPKTYFRVQVQVLPWVVRVNNIIL